VVPALTDLIFVRTALVTVGSVVTLSTVLVKSTVAVLVKSTVIVVHSRTVFWLIFIVVRTIIVVLRSRVVVLRSRVVVLRSKVLIVLITRRVSVVSELSVVVGTIRGLILRSGSVFLTPP